MCKFFFIVLLLPFFYVACGTNPSAGERVMSPVSVPAENKINGISFVASVKPYAGSEIEHLKLTYANHVALMPFGFLPTLTSSDLNFDFDDQWWGEQSLGCRKTIEDCKTNRFSIMLKPQLWVGGGEFTGLIAMHNEEEWKRFEQNYSRFILHFAKLAEETKTEIYCIGTELGKFVAERPEFWSQLIKDVRAVFTGKLTYAENWDCFDAPLFLRELDYVGVDAYFPLSAKKSPSVDEIKAGWHQHLEKLRACSLSSGKPILFTECGYRSVDFAGEKPWDFSHKNAAVNQELQARLLQVMFDLWKYDWMAGGFIWKWFPFHERAGGPKDDQFTPQNKRAQHTITRFYKANAYRNDQPN